MKTRAIKINMGHEPIITSEQQTNQHYSPACSFLLDHKLPKFAAARQLNMVTSTMVVYS